MIPSDYLDRKQLAAVLGMKLGTFWKKVLEFNSLDKAVGGAGLQPDLIDDQGNFKKFYYHPERVHNFRAAIEMLGNGQPGRPLKSGTNASKELTPS